MKYILAALALSLMALPARADVSPRDGGPLPQALRERAAGGSKEFATERAWAAKAARAKAVRMEYLRTPAGSSRTTGSLPAEAMVAGTIRVPVLCGYFSNEVSSPYPISTLSDKLFNNPSNTVTSFWNEASYNNLTLTGTVYGWTQVSNTRAYYAGLNNGLNPTTDRLGEFIKELLDAHDGAVNFGQFDNDGPDGNPNSGDDDGYVDFLSVVNSGAGAECGGMPTAIWSHRWVYTAWNVSGGFPYSTNDPRTGGGFIQVDDYTVQPALNCTGGTPIDIGVFCHEFGHALGLPDLYDTNGNGEGIGHWGIMGSGNWNTTTSPAQPEAWTRMEMGWLTPTVVDWTDASYNIPTVETTPTAFLLPFTDDRFRRSTTCAITGAYSLYCGLTAAEGTTRGWVSPGPTGGYGSGWIETIERDFTYSGSGAVTLGYKYRYDVETGYDYAMSSIEVNGAETLLDVYNGTGTGTATIPVTAMLSPLAGAGGTYTIKFLVISDGSFADDDGNNPTTCGALAIDDVTVTGGGEAFSSGFETYADGWHQDPAENFYDEYWLVENRQRVGTDINLHGAGLCIWHVDQPVMRSFGQQNSAGPNGIMVRGLVLEEADGNFNLNTAPRNRGVPGDVFPGTTNNTTFNSASTPNSRDNTNRTTQVAVTAISASQATMTATMKAGDLPPTASAIAPNNFGNDQTAMAVAITGTRIRYGATMKLTYTGSAVAANGRAIDPSDVIPLSVSWVDPVRLLATLNVFGKTPGTWDLVVTNPDGQSVTLAGAVTLNPIVATQLVSASVTPHFDSVHLRYVLLDQDDDETLVIWRSSAGVRDGIVIAEDLRPGADGVYAFDDTRVASGARYDYLLESRRDDGTTREIHRATVTVPTRQLSLSQNIPNPFNPATTIRYALPEAGSVRLAIYDASGALVRTLVSGPAAAGSHDALWNGKNDAGASVSSGVYLYRLEAGKQVRTRKMILLK